MDVHGCNAWQYVELNELTAYDLYCPQIFIDPINRIIGNYLAPN